MAEKVKIVREVLALPGLWKHCPTGQWDRRRGDWEPPPPTAVHESFFYTRNAVSDFSNLKEATGVKINHKTKIASKFEFLRSLVGVNLPHPIKYLLRFPPL